MKTSFCLLAIMSVMAFSNSSFAKKVDEAKVILTDLHKGTAYTKTPLEKLPQNFGGNAPKIANDRPADYSGTALKLALADETVFQDVMKDIIYPLEQMLLKRDLDLKKVSSKLAEVKWRDLSNNVTQSGNIKQISWSKADKALSLKKADAKIEKELKKYRSLDYAKLSPFSISSSIASRDPLTSLPVAFDVETRIDLRFIGKKGERIHDRGVLSLSVKKDLKSKKWLITSMKVVEGETLIAERASFKEVNPFKKGELANHLRKEAIRRGGYALALGDLDGDTHVDMIVGHLGPVEVFKGNADGSFKKIANEKLGIGQDTLVKSAVIADFDNDGKKDLLLVRFAPSEEEGKDLVLYKNTDNKFKKVGSIKNRYPAYYAMPSAVGDFDGNGMLDFYIGFPGAKDFTVLSKTTHGFEGKKEFNPQGLFYNVGGFNFEEVTREKLPYTKSKNAYTDGYPEAAAIFPHSSAAIDYDLDGNMDIIVVDDKANLSPLYKNTGGGSFEQVADKIGLTNYDFGMGFTYSDLDNDGKFEFIYTNVNFLPAERLHNSLKKNFSDYSKLPGTFGLRMFKTRDNKNYSDVTSLAGINGCGDGIGGVEVIDYDNNGLPDIYVANGLWSGTHSNQDLSSLFVRANATYNYDFQEVLGQSHGIEEAHTSFMKILTGFQGDVETMARKKGVHPSMAGFQRNCLFKNNGDGTFTEVGFLEGVDSIADGYIVGTADLNKDGKMDLVLRNGDPGVDVNRFPAIQVFVNQTEQQHKSAIISLKGTKSNKDAFGAIAWAKISGKTVVRHLIANNGAAQSEAVLHFGLNGADKIDELKIRWPSGMIQKMKDLKPGRHHFIEPEDSPKTAER